MSLFCSDFGSWTQPVFLWIWKVLALWGLRWMFLGAMRTSDPFPSPSGNATCQFERLQRCTKKHALWPALATRLQFSASPLKVEADMRFAKTCDECNGILADSIQLSYQKAKHQF